MNSVFLKKWWKAGKEIPKGEQSRQKVVKSFATGAFVIEEDLQLT